MERGMYYYRCKNCKVMISKSSERKLPEMCICDVCKGVAYKWENGGLFWKLLNEYKTSEAEKLLRE